MERAPQLARRPHDADDVMERELERESVQRANPLRGAHADTGSAPATEAHLLFAALAIDAAVLCVVLCSQISILLGLMKRSSVSDGARPWNTSTAHVHTCTPQVYAVYARATQLSAAALSAAAVSAAAVSTAPLSAAPLSAAAGAQHTQKRGARSRDFQARKDLHSCSTAAPGEGRRGARTFACQPEFPEFPEFVSGGHVL